MKFKAGDKVWVVCDNIEFNLHGTKPGVVTQCVVQPEGLRSDWWYAVELEEFPHPRGGGWISAEKHLFPRDEDGRQVGEWRNTIWKPTKERIYERIKELTT